MCAIAGMLTSEVRDLSSIFSMTQVQAHRGPDGEGHAIFNSPETTKPDLIISKNAKSNAGRIALGHRRLSIIDLDVRSAQPMGYAGGRYWITYNGEIYNYAELRDELIDLGYTFRTESDTEVILASYVHWGVNCFSRLNGMWALALWDSVEQVLVLCRDRFGIKPLHYSLKNKTLYFSSEIKGLIASGGPSARADQRVVYDYLTYGLVNSDGKTFFEDIYAFPPGCYALIDINQLTVNPIKYWLPLSGVDLGGSISYDDACEKFRNLLSSSVKGQMRSDVRIGACLSGGLDSSSIVSIMARSSNEAVHSFTAGFNDPRFDESPWAKIVSDKLHLQEDVVFPTEEGLMNNFERLVWHQEEPFTSASLYAQWLVVSRAHQKGVKVLLDGQGADEVLAGYLKFYAFYIIILLRNRRYAKGIGEVIKILKNGDRGYLNWKNLSRYLPRVAGLPHAGVKRFLQREMLSLDQGLKSKLYETDGIPDRQVRDINAFSLPALLRYEDRNSMAWSVESRVPFLDHNLVEFIIGLPNEYKFRGGRTKAILRAGMRGVVPDEILDRRDKMGFVTPQSEWMMSNLDRFIESLCRDSAAVMGRWIDLDAAFKDWHLSSPRKKSLNQDWLFRIGVLSQWIECFKIGRP